MKEGRKNLLVAVVAISLVGISLLIQFHPTFQLKDTILSLVELPKNVFSFLWEPPKAEDPIAPVVAVQKTETPLVLFDDTPQVAPDEDPQEIIPGDNVGRLPMDYLVNHSGETRR